ncbi:cellulose binding domain-containing protein [Sorangium sp. So ce1153]|uniref:cellulose binding domain-containing protein n=1 Tax=Sorangium sp. So ce1153 TaxID=3133333 RepID=UPI003F620D5C
MHSALSSPDGTIQAELTLPAQWGNGYCASVTVKNTTVNDGRDVPPASWGVVIGLNGSTLNNAWNVRVTPSGEQFTAINESYNTLKPGASTVWGFCGSGTGRPALVSVNGPGGSTTSTSASSSSSSSTSASSGGGEGGATGTGGAGGEGGDVTTAGAGGEGAGTTTAGAGGEGAGTTTTAGAGGEGAGTSTTTAGVGGAGGEGATTTTTAGVGGAGGEGAGTTTTTAGVGGAGGEGAGTTATTAGVGGAGGEGAGSTTTAGVGGAGGEGGGSSIDPACGPDTATFADVHPILTRSCAGCHGSPAAPAGLDLRQAMAVGALVDQDARSCSSEHALVVPGSPSSSYLMNKLNDTGLCDPDESRMPPGTPLPAADIKTINDWICAGAPAD